MSPNPIIDATLFRTLCTASRIDVGRLGGTYGSRPAYESVENDSSEDPGDEGCTSKGRWRTGTPGSSGESGTLSSGEDEDDELEVIADLGR